MRILGIETSCDETAVCIIEAEGVWDAGFSYTVLGNALLSQTIHSHYGGVFPNLARREHENNLVPLLERALGEADLLHPKNQDKQGDTLLLEDILKRESELRPQLIEFLANHKRPDIDVIAVTHGPGLEPALWVGVNVARALATAWDVPIVPVNHMEGHIVVSMMEEECLAPVSFPLLSLLISGGHTELVLSREWMQYELIGQTRDDAVGEAFDKVARLLGLPYPGGPEIDRLANRARAEGIQSPEQLPRPMINTDNYDFSFSGLKTAVKRLVESQSSLTEEIQMGIAREFEEACADVLVAKTLRAIEEYNVESLVVGGGVSANEYIRERLAEGIKEYGLSTKLLVPPRALATDNALMIALAGYFRAIKSPPAGGFVDLNSIRASGNLKLV